MDGQILTQTLATNAIQMQRKRVIGAVTLVLTEEFSKAPMIHDATLCPKGINIWEVIYRKWIVSKALSRSPYFHFAGPLH